MNNSKYLIFVLTKYTNKNFMGWKNKEFIIDTYSLKEETKN